MACQAQVVVARSLGGNAMGATMMAHAACVRRASCMQGASQHLLHAIHAAMHACLRAEPLAAQQPGLSHDIRHTPHKLFSLTKKCHGPWVDSGVQLDKMLTTHP